MVGGMKDNDLADLRLNTIGFVFQTFQLLPRQTALDNVALPLIYAGVPKAERMKRAAAALDKVGLSDRMNFIPNQLSGGQKQRVAIARAIVNNPEILLADEPTGALDSKSSHQVMELFQKLNDEGVTVVMITHDSHVAQCAKRIVDIFDGEISERDRKGRKLFEEKECDDHNGSGTGVCDHNHGDRKRAVRGGGSAVDVTQVSYLNSGWWDEGTSTSGYVTANASQDVYLESDSVVEKVYVKRG